MPYKAHFHPFKRKVRLNHIWYSFSHKRKGFMIIKDHYSLDGGFRIVHQSGGFLPFHFYRMSKAKAVLRDIISLLDKHCLSLNNLDLWQIRDFCGSKEGLFYPLKALFLRHSLIKPKIVSYEDCDIPSYEKTLKTFRQILDRANEIRTP